jgi:hypothetical protein
MIVQSGGKVSDPQPARKQLPEIEKHATCFSRHPLQIQQEELHDARKACIAMHWVFLRAFSMFFIGNTLGVCVHEFSMFSGSV